MKKKKVWVRRVKNGLFPSSRYDHDIFTQIKIPENKDVLANFEIMINPEFHRKFMAMVRKAYDNQDWCDNFDAYRKYLTKKAGFFVKTVYPNGFIDYDAESLAFGNMDAPTFEDVYYRVADVIVEEIGVDKKDLIEEIEGFLE